MKHLKEKAEFYGGLAAGKKMQWRDKGISGQWSVWIKGSAEPVWAEDLTYQIREAPSTITLPEREIPEPMREKPEQGTRYYVIDFNEPDFVENYTWFGDSNDKLWLSLGLIFDTPQKAAAAARAMCPFSPEDEE